MENIVSSLLCGLMGSGVGGAIVWLAIQKVIDDSIEKKQKPMWCAIDKIRDDLRQDYCSKDVCNEKHSNVDKENKRIEETLIRIETKIDNIKK
jgi:hypothetical protein